jgi:hypothetical protein
MLPAGFLTVVANRAQMYTADHVIPLYCRPQNAMKNTIVSRIATNMSPNFRADCQGVIPVVANRFILRAVCQGVIPVVKNRGTL